MKREKYSSALSSCFWVIVNTEISTVCVGLNLLMKAVLSKSNDRWVVWLKESYQVLAMPFKWKGNANAARSSL